MRSLYILRHAKAQRSPTFEDFDRPLEEKGCRRAAAMGAAFPSLKVQPDLILCSASKRTRETLDHVRPGLPPKSPVLIEDGLYMASVEALIRRLRKVPNTARSVMIIGHNPGLQELGLLLGSEDPDPDARRRLVADLPPAALVILTGPLPGWHALAPGTLRLERLIKAKDMERD